MFDYGYNVDLGSVPLEQFINDARLSKSRYHVVMATPPNGIPTNGDLGTLWTIYNALKDHVDGQLHLIWRFYNKHEGNFSQYPDPAIYKTVLSAMELPPGTILDSFINEPNMNNMSYVTADMYLQKELGYLIAMNDIGVDYAVGAFSTGTPHEQLIMDGVFDRLIRESKYLSLHLYGVLPFEAEFNYELMLKNESNRQFTRDILLSGRRFEAWDNETSGYLLNRHKFWEQRAKQLGVDMPKVLITEGFVDIIGDVPSQIRDSWKRDFGIEIYQNDPRGILTWFDYLQWVLPELTVSESLELLMRHLRDDILNEDYLECMALFGYNRNWDYPYGSHKESGHNWENPALSEFRRKHLGLINMDNTTVTNTNPGYNGTVGLLWSAKNSNMRTDPSISDITLARDENGNLLSFTPDEKLTVMMLEEDIPGFDNNYKWYRFVHPDYGMILYVAKTSSVNWLPEENDDENRQYVVDFFGATQIMSLSELEEIIETQQTLIDFIGEVKAEGENNEYTLDFFDNFVTLISEIKDDDIQKLIDIHERVLVAMKRAKELR